MRLKIIKIIVAGDFGEGKRRSRRCPITKRTFFGRAAAETQIRWKLKYLLFIFNSFLMMECSAELCLRCAFHFRFVSFSFHQFYDELMNLFGSIAVTKLPLLMRCMERSPVKWSCCAFDIVIRLCFIWHSFIFSSRLFNFLRRTKVFGARDRLRCVSVAHREKRLITSNRIICVQRGARVCAGPLPV